MVVVDDGQVLSHSFLCIRLVSSASFARAVRCMFDILIRRKTVMLMSMHQLTINWWNSKSTINSQAFPSWTRSGDAVCAPQCADVFIFFFLCIFSFISLNININIAWKIRQMGRQLICFSHVINFVFSSLFMLVGKSSAKQFWPIKNPFDRGKMQS